MAEKKKKLEDLSAKTITDAITMFNPVQRIAESAIEGAKALPSLPQRALEAAGSLQRGGSYDPGPALEATGLVMGGTAFGAPRGAIGAGPVGKPSALKPLDPQLMAKEFGMGPKTDVPFSDWPTFFGKPMHPDDYATVMKAARDIKALGPPWVGGAEAEAYAAREGLKPKDFSNLTIGELKDLQHGPSSPFTPSTLGDPTGVYSNMGLRYVPKSEIPREVPFGVPQRGQELGFNTPLVHGTTQVPQHVWEGGQQGNILQEDFGGFRLPSDEIGVHFGSPRAAHSFTATEPYYGSHPRQFPTVIQAQNPLEMADLGSWTAGKISRELERLGFDKKEVMAARMKPGANTEIQNLREFITDKGYDSIKYKNSVEDPGHTSYILIKSAPNQPEMVTGARVPWAKFDPAMLHDPGLLSGLGGLAALPSAVRQLYGTQPERGGQ